MMFHSTSLSMAKKDKWCSVLVLPHTEWNILSESLHFSSLILVRNCILEDWRISIRDFHHLSGRQYRMAKSCKFWYFLKDFYLYFLPVFPLPLFLLQTFLFLALFQALPLVALHQIKLDQARLTSSVKQKQAWIWPNWPTHDWPKLYWRSGSFPGLFRNRFPDKIPNARKTFLLSQSMSLLFIPSQDAANKVFCTFDVKSRQKSRLTLLTMAFFFYFVDYLIRDVQILDRIPSYICFWHPPELVTILRQKPQSKFRMISVQSYSFLLRMLKTLPASHNPFYDSVSSCLKPPTRIDMDLLKECSACLKHRDQFCLPCLCKWLHSGERSSSYHIVPCVHCMFPHSWAQQAALHFLSLQWMSMKLKDVRWEGTR